jgi:Fe-S cluster assembly iron-binding protein IscA
MVGVTERAKEELKRLLVTNSDDPQAGLRLSANASGRLGLALDNEMPGDQVVEHDNSKVLLVEKELSENLEGVTIDVEDALEGTRLILVKSGQ